MSDQPVGPGAGPLAGLPPLRVDGRADRLRARLADAGCEALLVTSLPNVRWLTGFTGSAGFVLVTASSLVLVTDGRYGVQAVEELAAAACDEGEVVERRTVAEQRAALAVRVTEAGITRLGLEADSVTWSAQLTYADLLAGVELVATSGILDPLRAVKDDAELARMQLAATIADEALAEVLPRLWTGVSERAFAAELEHAMRRRGAEGPSFPTIVAAGPNSAFPHHRAGDRLIAPGDLVVCDFGALVDGYCSDMTRTFCVGEPSAAQQQLVDVVAAAQRAGVAAIRSGVAVNAIDATCREVIAAAGWGDAFSHGTGHSLGLQIHEAPILAATTEGALATSYVVTVEPGVYLPGLGGVRIEDSVVVTEDGCRPLTRFPKALAVPR